MVIKSISYDQQEIINNILELYNNSQPIDFDPCYNIGAFYRNNVVNAPRVKSDINPLLPDVLNFDVRELPYNNCFSCIMFDPPFIVGGGTGIMATRYGSFKTVGELKEFYKVSLISLQRALTNDGLLIMKFQDFVYARKNYFIIDYIFSLARELSFIVLDLFILLSKTRPNRAKKQQHARKYHSYFIVLKKQ